jgi:hypothetical protein
LRARPPSPRETIFFPAKNPRDCWHGVAVPLDEVVRAIVSKLRLRVVRGEPFVLMDDD